MWANANEYARNQNRILESKLKRQRPGYAITTEIQRKYYEYKYQAKIHLTTAHSIKTKELMSSLIYLNISLYLDSQSTVANDWTTNNNRITILSAEGKNKERNRRH